MATIAVEAVTSSAVYGGQAAVPGERARLIDLLRLVSVLVLSDCSVRPLAKDAEPLASVTACHVPPNRIVWAHQVAEVREEADVPDFDRVEKVPHRIVMFASPFVIRGNIHLAPEADPTIAFERFAQGFFPVTDAAIAHLADPSASWELPLAVVNGVMVEAFGVDGTQAAAEAADGARAA